MENNFKERYKKIEKSKKLSFLKQLLEKDNTLQEQFLAFTKERIFDEITGVDIADIRTRIYNELVEIDIGAIFEERANSFYDYDDEMDGDEFIKELIDPYYKEVLDYLQKGNIIDAFRQTLAIYELSTLDIPEISDEYCFFGDGFDLAVDDFVSVYPNKLSTELTAKVLSVEAKKELLGLLFERYDLFERDELLEYKYKLNHFQSLIIAIVDEKEVAIYLLDILEEYNLYSISLALVLLQIATLLKDDQLFLKVANEFYLENEEIGYKLLEKYVEREEKSKFATVAEELLEKIPRKYSLYIVENLDNEVYKTLYIKALKAYVDIEYSMKHYKILREYLTKSERLEFIDASQDGYSASTSFYINVLELEKEYEMILNFAKTSDIYELPKGLKPIVSIYPDEVFEIIRTNCDELVEERGRGSYARASGLLSLMLGVKEKEEELKLYVNKLYNHKPVLRALRDELKRHGMLR